MTREWRANCATDRRVPLTDGLVNATGNDGLPIPSECDAADSAISRPQPLEIGMFGHDVREVNFSVRAAAYDPLPVWAEGCFVHLGRSTKHSAHLRERLGIPKPDGLIEACTYDELSVEAEGDARDIVFMPGQGCT